MPYDPSMSLMITGLVVIFSGALCALFGRPKTSIALNLLGCFLHLTGVVLRDEQLWAAVDAAVAAWVLWQWWNNGGGDNTRRRLRRWSRRFQGVRRTAPASAA
ncbi:hypothetical protein [Streptomyces tendae]|uniref:hypothetical protein n=1 Tax=Streptomyces tendae TaxID=1932 RepID=UPI003442A287